MQHSVRDEPTDSAMHESVSQQSVRPVHATDASPGRRQLEMSWHVPATQPSPLQHSLSCQHVALRILHAHSPPTHRMSPQQSPSPVHDVDPPAQQTLGRGRVVVSGCAPHVSPSQQPPDIAHDAPASVHITSVWQVKL